jgi:hypothetical protein
MKLQASSKISIREWVGRSARFRRGYVPTRSPRTQPRNVRAPSAGISHADEAITLSRLTALTQLILIKSGRVI